jgi:hypothetical protein
VNPTITKTVSILTIVAWGAFLFLDHLWQQCLTEAASRQAGTYGEIYGPVSFFRQTFLYSAAVSSVACAFLLFRRPLSPIEEQ